MNRYFHTLLACLATILLMVAAAACVEPLTPDAPKQDPNAVALPIRIYLPASAIATKAGDDKSDPDDPDDPVRASAAECAVNGLQVWAFIHRTADESDIDKEGALAYVFVPVLSQSDAMRTMDVELYLPSYVKDALPRMEFYVLANAETLGFDPDNAKWRKYTRGDIKAEYFGDASGNGFGGNLVKTVPSEGLPMAGFFDNDGAGYDLSILKYGFTSAQLDYIKRHNGDVYDDTDSMFIALGFTDEQIAIIHSHCIVSGRWNYAALFSAALAPTLTLSRAVNRVHFVFAKIAGYADATEITRIEMTSIPDQTFVFPRSASKVTVPDQTTYTPISYPKAGEAALLRNADVAFVDNPLRLRKDSTIQSEGESKAPGNMTADEYESFLSREIAAGHATRRTLYLRESDKPLTGKIYYKVGTEEKMAIFDLKTIASSFPRNTTWTVYAYFASYGLHLHVYINAWNTTGDPGHHLKR